MKNFIKKYPKRVITAALAVLLIAVIGTVNNYETYRGDHKLITGRTMKYLESIYGEGKVLVKTEIPTISKMGANVYYDAGGEYVPIDPNIKIGELKGIAYMKTDKDVYSHSETVVVTLKKLGTSKLEFDSGKYILQVLRDDRWYNLPMGEACVPESEIVEIDGRGDWEFSVKLDEINGRGEQSIKLKKGRYRICKEVVLTPGNSYESVLNTNIFCRFEIK